MPITCHRRHQTWIALTLEALHAAEVDTFVRPVDASVLPAIPQVYGLEAGMPVAMEPASVLALPFLHEPCHHRSPQV